MSKKMQVEHAVLTALVILLGTFPLGMWAQMTSPHVGDRVAVKGGVEPMGTITALDMNNTLATVRGDNGMTMYAQFSTLSPAGAASGAKGVGGAGLLSDRDVAGYVTANRGVPSGQLCKALDDAIKARGVSFKYDYNNPVLQPLTSSDCSYQPWDLMHAVQYNYGTPVTLGFFMGKWNLEVIGGTVDRAHNDGYIYRQGEIGAKGGTLQVNGDNTFVWAVANVGTINGKWRLATDAEKGLYGGAGIVLLGGEMGQDWVVHRWIGDPNTMEAMMIKDGGGVRRLGKH